MNTPLNPFDTFVFDKLDDICENKHQGNQQSVAGMADDNPSGESSARRTARIYDSQERSDSGE